MEPQKIQASMGLDSSGEPPFFRNQILVIHYSIFSNSKILSKEVVDTFLLRRRELSLYNASLP